MRRGDNGRLGRYQQRQGGVRPASGAWSVLYATCVLVALSTAVTHAQPAATEPNSCIACHATLSDARLSRPAALFAGQDVHRTQGFLCIDCHGGNPTSIDKAKAHDVAGRESAMAFRGKPA